MSDFEVLMIVLIEIHEGGSDEHMYALRAGGYHSVVDKFNTYFVLKMPFWSSCQKCPGSKYYHPGSFCNC